MRIHPNGYWISESEEDRKEHCFDSHLCAAIGNMFQESLFIYDFGCGPGDYISNLLLYFGQNVIGFEGDPAYCDHYLIEHCDLTAFDYSKYKQPDLILSLEVGEHIPKEHESSFLDLCAWTTEYSVISWAIPNQGGTGHVNCQTNEYIIDQMKQRGMQFCDTKTNFLRSKSTLPWFKNTLMVFKK